MNLQVDVLDRDVPNHVAAVRLCNRLRFALAYRSTGAADIAGFTLPRSEFSHDAPLTGDAGDPLTVEATFGNEAVVATAAMVFFDVVAPAAGLSRTLRWGLTNTDAITLITNSARACAGAVDAARSRPGVDTWESALACLGALDDFPRLVLELIRNQTLDELGEAAVARTAAAVQGPLRVALAAQPIIRLAAERWYFGSPEELGFPYRLRCSSTAGCAPRLEPQPAGIDPANHRYALTCAGEVDQPVDVDVADGAGEAGLGGGRTLQVGVVTAVRGDITGDARADDALLLSCSPQPSNFTIPVIVVVPGDGSPAVELPLIEPIGDSGYPIPQYVEEDFAVDGGRLRTGVLQYAADESHADQPSVHHLYRWRWAGGTPVAERAAADEDPTLDVTAFALRTARATGLGPDSLATVSCPEPARRPTGSTVLCELVPRSGPAEPGYVAVRVLDAGQQRAEGIVVAGDVACNEVPDWAFELQSQASGIFCGE